MTFTPAQLSIHKRATKAARCPCCYGSGKQLTRMPQHLKFDRMAECPNCDGRGHMLAPAQ